MTSVIQYPGVSKCSACGSKLRPATEKEIQQGLADENAVTRQIYAYAVQGDVNRTFVADNEYTRQREQEGETVRGTWVLVCTGEGCNFVEAKSFENENTL